MCTLEVNITRTAADCFPAVHPAAASRPALGLPRYAEYMSLALAVYWDLLVGTNIDPK